MYKWSFYDFEWTDEEKEEIRLIVKDSLKLFNYGVWKNTEDFEGYIADHIEKNSTYDYPTEEYDGHSNEELIAKFKELKDFFGSDEKYERYLKFVEKLERNCEIFPGDNRKLSKHEIEGIIDKIDQVLKSDACRNGMSSWGMDDLDNDEADSEETDPVRKKIEDFKKFIGGMAFKTIRLGEYDCKENKITIYMKAIDCCSEKVNRNILVEEVLVHELFHAMHYAFAEMNIIKTWNNKSRENYKKKLVKESLADFFAYTYLVPKTYGLYFMRPYHVKGEEEEYKRATEEMLEKWNRHDPMVYPYSGAKAYIFRHNPYGDSDTEEEHGGYDFLQVKKGALCRWRIQYKTIVELLK